MLLMKPRVEFLWYTPNAEKIIEIAARTCYKSEALITGDSSRKMIEKLIANGHEAMLEHAQLSMRFICDRGVTHEIVRHRLFSFAQESTRYCNYSKTNVGVKFIIPCWLKLKEGIHEINMLPEVGEVIDTPEDAWLYAMYHAERFYLGLLANGWTPQQARSVLPNSLKTEIIVTGNLREWRHFFKLRTAKAAHPQMREVAIDALYLAKVAMPNVFKDIKEEV
jgi:thymidylate synthase (FAD)